MIHYSIVPLEYILSEDESNNFGIKRLIEYKGCQIEVTSSNGITKINRIISTSPRDFLSNDLQPGTIISDIF